MSEGPNAGARSESAGVKKTLQFEGLKLKIPAKMPFNAVEYLGENMDGPATFAVLEVILGEEQMAQVKALNLDVDSGLKLLEQVMGKLEVKAGK